MSNDDRNPQPQLQNQELAFFYEILTRIESPLAPYQKTLGSRELNNITRTKVSISYDPMSPTPLGNNEIRYAAGKKYKTYKLLKFLRDAFAHNYIRIDNHKIIYINSTYRGKLKMVAQIAFSNLKELVETIWGMHNLPQKN